MDFCVLGTMAMTSVASGAVVTTQGWAWLNVGSLLPIVAIAIALLWLGRRAAPAALSAPG
ncbi:MAG: hypothetical protein ABIX12_16810 [Rubrivivax sp.]